MWSYVGPPYLQRRYRKRQRRASSPRQTCRPVAQALPGEGGAAFSYSEEQQLEDDDAFIPEVVRDERTISTKLKA